MRRFIIMFFLTSTLLSCDRQVKEQTLLITKSDLLGVWSNDDHFLLFKDSVCLPFDFYLYTNWKLDSNEIQIYNLESSIEKDSLWMTYLIKSFSKDSLVLTSSVFNLDSSEVTLYREEPDIETKFDHIKLIRPTYPGEDLIAEINLKKNGEVKFKEITKKKRYAY